MDKSTVAEQVVAGSSVRQPQHHGTFYPADPGLLRKQLDDYLLTEQVDSGRHQPKAMVIPHAGYDYSGRVAALAYSALQNQAWIQRIAIVAPNHQTLTTGGLLCGHDFWATPLGQVAIDRSFIAQHWENISGVSRDDGVHQLEYSIEVQLPFIQRALPTVPIAPILLGECTSKQVADILSPAWECPDTFIIISSDLYHYLPRESALPGGMAIAQAIEQNNIAEIGPEHACGSIALVGLMHLARQDKLNYWRTLAVSHSGTDNRFNVSSLVGYGAFLLFTPPVSRLSD